MSNAAVRGWLVAALILIGGPLCGQDNRQQESQTKQAANEQLQPSPAVSILSFPFDILTVGKREKEIEADWGEPNCAAPKNHDEADLCQQRETVKVAKEALYLNQIQLGIGIVTGIFIAVTIYYTRKAAIGAINAADASKDSAEVAQSALTLAEDTAKKQLRAYVGGGMPVPFLDGIYTKIKLTFENYGQTPAYNVIAYFEVGAIPYGESENVVFSFDAIWENQIGCTHLGTLYPRQAVPYDFPVEKDLLEDAVNLRKTCFIYGGIRYNDSMDPEIIRKTKFCFEMIVNPERTDKWFHASRIHKDHNDAT